MFQLNHLKPVGEGCAGTAILGDDGIWLGGPDERLGVEVAVFDPVGDRGFEFGYAGEGAAADALARDLGKQPLDEVEPGRGCRGEVRGEAGVSLEPALDRGRLVGGVIVEDQMQVEIRGYLAVDDLEEGEELLGAMARQDASAPRGRLAADMA